MAQWVNDPDCFFGGAGSIPGPAQWAKDLELLQLWCRLQLRFSPWPGNSICLGAAKQKEKPKTFSGEGPYQLRERKPAGRS